MAVLTDIISAGSTGRSITVTFLDSTTGLPKTGLLYNSAGAALWSRRELNAKGAITLVARTLLTDAWVSGGFLEIGDGQYRLDCPDTFWGAGPRDVTIGGVFTGAVMIAARVLIVPWDPYDGVRLGMTALPNAVVNAANGLFTRGTGAGQINQDANGRINVNAVAFLNTPATLTGGLPDVNAKTMDTAVATQVRDAIRNMIVDDSALASVATTSQVTLQQALSICLSYAAGRTSNNGNTLSTPDNVKVRITGASSGNVRTSIALTPSG